MLFSLLLLSVVVVVVIFVVVVVISAAIVVVFVTLRNESFSVNEKCTFPFKKMTKSEL